MASEDLLDIFLNDVQEEPGTNKAQSDIVGDASNVAIINSLSEVESTSTDQALVLPVVDSLDITFTKEPTEQQYDLFGSVLNFGNSNDSLNLGGNSDIHKQKSSPESNVLLDVPLLADDQPSNTPLNQDLLGLFGSNDLQEKKSADSSNIDLLGGLLQPIVDDQINSAESIYSPSVPFDLVNILGNTEVFMDHNLETAKKDYNEDGSLVDLLMENAEDHHFSDLESKNDITSPSQNVEKSENSSTNADQNASATVDNLFNTETSEVISITSSSTANDILKPSPDNKLEEFSIVFDTGEPVDTEKLSSNTSHEISSPLLSISTEESTTTNENDVSSKTLTDIKVENFSLVIGENVPGAEKLTLPDNNFETPSMLSASNEESDKHFSETVPALAETSPTLSHGSADTSEATMSKVNTDELFTQTFSNKVNGNTDHEISSTLSTHMSIGNVLYDSAVVDADVLVATEKHGLSPTLLNVSAGTNNYKTTGNVDTDLFSQTQIGGEGDSTEFDENSSVVTEEESLDDNNAGLPSTLLNVSAETDEVETTSIGLPNVNAEEFSMVYGKDVLASSEKTTVKDDTLEGTKDGSDVIEFSVILGTDKTVATVHDDNYEKVSTYNSTSPEKEKGQTTIKTNEDDLSQKNANGDEKEEFIAAFEADLLIAMEKSNPHDNTDDILPNVTFEPSDIKTRNAENLPLHEEILSSRTDAETSPTSLNANEVSAQSSTSNKVEEFSFAFGEDVPAEIEKSAPHDDDKDMSSTVLNVFSEPGEVETTSDLDVIDLSPQTLIGNQAEESSFPFVKDIKAATDNLTVFDTDNEITSTFSNISGKKDSSNLDDSTTQTLISKEQFTVFGGDVTAALGKSTVINTSSMVSSTLLDVSAETSETTTANEVKEFSAVFGTDVSAEVEKMPLQDDIHKMPSTVLPNDSATTVYNLTKGESESFLSLTSIDHTNTMHCEMSNELDTNNGDNKTDLFSLEKNEMRVQSNKIPDNSKAEIPLILTDKQFITSSSMSEPQALLNLGELNSDTTESDVKLTDDSDELKQVVDNLLNSVYYEVAKEITGQEDIVGFLTNGIMKGNVKNTTTISDQLNISDASVPELVSNTVDRSEDNNVPSKSESNSTALGIIDMNSVIDPVISINEVPCISSGSSTLNSDELKTINEFKTKQPDDDADHMTFLSEANKTVSVVVSHDDVDNNSAHGIKLGNKTDDMSYSLPDIPIHFEEVSDAVLLPGGDKFDVLSNVTTDLESPDKIKEENNLITTAERYDVNENYMQQPISVVDNSTPSPVNDIKDDQLTASEGQTVISQNESMRLFVDGFEEKLSDIDTFETFSSEEILLAKESETSNFPVQNDGNMENYTNQSKIEATTDDFKDVQFKIETTSSLSVLDISTNRTSQKSGMDFQSSNVSFCENLAKEILTNAIDECFAEDHSIGSSICDSLDDKEDIQSMVSDIPKLENESDLTQEQILEPTDQPSSVHSNSPEISAVSKDNTETHSLFDASSLNHGSAIFVDEFTENNCSSGLITDISKDFLSKEFFSEDASENQSDGKSELGASSQQNNTWETTDQPLINGKEAFSSIVESQNNETEVSFFSKKEEKDPDDDVKMGEETKNEGISQLGCSSHISDFASVENDNPDNLKDDTVSPSQSAEMIDSPSSNDNNADIPAVEVMPPVAPKRKKKQKNSTKVDDDVSGFVKIDSSHTLELGDSDETDIQSQALIMAEIPSSGEPYSENIKIDISNINEPDVKADQDTPKLESTSVHSTDCEEHAPDSNNYLSGEVEEEDSNFGDGDGNRAEVLNLDSQILEKQQFVSGILSPDEDVVETIPETTSETLTEEFNEKTLSEGDVSHSINFNEAQGEEALIHDLAGSNPSVTDSSEVAGKSSVLSTFTSDVTNKNFNLIDGAKVSDFSIGENTANNGPLSIDVENKAPDNKSSVSLIIDHNPFKELESSSTPDSFINDDGDKSKVNFNSDRDCSNYGQFPNQYHDDFMSEKKSDISINDIGEEMNDFSTENNGESESYLKVDTKALDGAAEVLDNFGKLISDIEFQESNLQSEQDNNSIVQDQVHEPSANVSHAFDSISPPPLEFDDMYQDEALTQKNSIATNFIKKTQSTTSERIAIVSPAYTGSNYSSTVPSSVFIDKDLLSDDSDDDSLAGNVASTSEDEEWSTDNDHDKMKMEVEESMKVYLEYSTNDEQDVHSFPLGPFVPSNSEEGNYTYQGFDSDWEEIAQEHPRYPILPSIMEESEPSDDDEPDSIEHIVNEKKRDNEALPGMSYPSIIVTNNDEFMNHTQDINHSKTSEIPSDVDEPMERDQESIQTTDLDLGKTSTADSGITKTQEFSLVDSKNDESIDGLVDEKVSKMNSDAESGIDEKSDASSDIDSHSVASGQNVTPSGGYVKHKICVSPELSTEMLLEIDPGKSRNNSQDIVGHMILSEDDEHFDFDQEVSESSEYIAGNIIKSVISETTEEDTLIDDILIYSHNIDDHNSVEKSLPNKNNATFTLDNDVDLGTNNEQDNASIETSTSGQKVKSIDDSVNESVNTKESVTENGSIIGSGVDPKSDASPDEDLHFVPTDQDDTPAGGSPKQSESIICVSPEPFPEILFETGSAKSPENSKDYGVHMSSLAVDQNADLQQDITLSSGLIAENIIQSVISETVTDENNLIDSTNISQNDNDNNFVENLLPNETLFDVTLNNDGDIGANIEQNDAGNKTPMSAILADHDSLLDDYVKGSSEMIDNNSEKCITGELHIVAEGEIKIPTNISGMTEWMKGETNQEVSHMSELVADDIIQSVLIENDPGYNSKPYVQPETMFDATVKGAAFDKEMVEDKEEGFDTDNTSSESDSSEELSITFIQESEEENTAPTSIFEHSLASLNVGDTVAETQSDDSDTTEIMVAKNEDITSPHTNEKNISAVPEDGLVKKPCGPVNTVEGKILSKATPIESTVPETNDPWEQSNIGSKDPSGMPVTVDNENAGQLVLTMQDNKEMKVVITPNDNFKQLSISNTNPTIGNIRLEDEVDTGLEIGIIKNASIISNRDNTSSDGKGLLSSDLVSVSPSEKPYTAESGSISKNDIMETAILNNTVVNIVYNEPFTPTNPEKGELVISATDESKNPPFIPGSFETDNGSNGNVTVPSFDHFVRPGSPTLVVSDVHHTQTSPKSTKKSYDIELLPTDKDIHVPPPPPPARRRKKGKLVKDPLEENIDESSLSQDNAIVPDRAEKEDSTDLNYDLTKVADSCIKNEQPDPNQDEFDDKVHSYGVEPKKPKKRTAPLPPSALNKKSELLFFQDGTTTNSETHKDQIDSDTKPQHDVVKSDIKRHEDRSFIPIIAPPRRSKKHAPLPPTETSVEPVQNQTKGLDNGNIEIAETKKKSTKKQAPAPPPLQNDKIQNVEDFQKSKSLEKSDIANQDIDLSYLETESKKDLLVQDVVHKIPNEVSISKGGEMGLVDDVSPTLENLDGDNLLSVKNNDEPFSPTDFPLSELSTDTSLDVQNESQHRPQSSVSQKNSNDNFFTTSLLNESSNSPPPSNTLEEISNNKPIISSLLDESLPTQGDLIAEVTPDGVIVGAKVVASYDPIIPSIMMEILDQVNNDLENINQLSEDKTGGYELQKTEIIAVSQANQVEENKNMSDLTQTQENVMSSRMAVKPFDEALSDSESLAFAATQNQTPESNENVLDVFTDNMTSTILDLSSAQLNDTDDLISKDQMKASVTHVEDSETNTEDIQESAEKLSQEDSEERIFENELNVSTSPYHVPLKKGSDDKDVEKSSHRIRYDTTGSVGSLTFLTDSEEEEDDSERLRKNQEKLISLDDDAVVDEDDIELNDTFTSEDHLTKGHKKSLVPPSSLILSIALDDVDLSEEGTKAVGATDTLASELETNLASSVGSSQTSIASSTGDATGKRSSLPKLPSLRRKKPTEPTTPPMIRTNIQFIPKENIIPISPKPDSLTVIRWEKVTVKNIEYQIDETAIQPYKKVISHGGFYDDKSPIIEIFTSYLPSSNTEHYAWVMDNLFLYVLATVELLASEKFSVVMFVGHTPKNRIPANSLLKKWHEHADYRLKKNVEAFYIMNPTFYFKAMATLFVSRKVMKKMKYIKSMAELKAFIPIDFLFVPPEIAK